MEIDTIIKYKNRNFDLGVHFNTHSCGVIAGLSQTEAY